MRKASFWLLAGGIMLWWLLAAWLLPPAQDEAYYFLWGRHLALGYFDHPPLVALMAATAKWAPAAPFVARIGTLVVGALTIIFSRSLFRRVGLTSPRALTAALLLSHGNLLGLIYGFITTPDTALILCWVIALNEAAAALQGQEKRWLTAGAATGLGLMAKYTMLLMGPVFLWALIKQPKQLRRPWPYLGGVVALLVFLPNIAWNAQHDWITFKFQLRHGFSMARPELAEAGALPAAEEAPQGSVEVALALPFLKLEEEAKKEEKKPGKYDEALKALNRYVGYYSSQVGLWGFFLAVPVVMLWERRKSRPGRRGGPQRLAWRPGESLIEEARPLLVAATLVPLLVFGLLSLGSKVEANWSAMYVFAAAALLAPFALARTRLLTAVASVHMSLLVIAVAHARSGFLPTRAHRDRLLVETHGYRELAGRLAELDGPVFTDTYQTAAMVRFWRPDLHIRQWPGITRVSEFLRNPQFADLSLPQLEEQPGFWLVQNGVIPPRLAGFTPTSLAMLRDCVDDGLQELDAKAATSPESRCRRPVHEWYLSRYAPATPRDHSSAAADTR